MSDDCIAAKGQLIADLGQLGFLLLC